MENHKIDIRLRTVIIKEDKLLADYKAGFPNEGEYLGRMDK